MKRMDIDATIKWLEIEKGNRVKGDTMHEALERAIEALNICRSLKTITAMLDKAIKSLEQEEENEQKHQPDA